MSKTYKIEVDCANCAEKMQDAANKTEGVAEAVVSFIGLALLLVIDLSAVSMVDRSAIIIVMLAAMGMGIVYLRMGKACQVEVDGEQMRVVSRFGRTAEFSVRNVSSVSRSLGWLVLYDREFKTLAKVDSCLEDMDRLKEYLASYGIKMLSVRGRM